MARVALEQAPFDFTYKGVNYRRVVQREERPGEDSGFTCCSGCCFEGDGACPSSEERRAQLGAGLFCVVPDDYAEYVLEKA